MDLEHFLHDANQLTLVIGLFVAAAALLSFTASRLRIPAPLAFLLIGVAVQSFTERTFDVTSGEALVPLGTIALAIVLFEGGFHGGWSRMRAVLGSVLSIGLLGTILTAGALAAFGHWALGLSWLAASLVAIALAPTDPAAVFSVLGGQQLRGDAGTVLEGESGVNDPIAIALMLGAIGLAGTGDTTVAGIAASFGTELLVGGICGVVIGLGANVLLTHVPLPSPAIHATAAVSTALLAYGLTAQLHGSGFLAAFIAGMVVGERDVIEHRIAEDTLSVGAHLAETAMFFALGLTIPFERLDDNLLIELALFAALTFVVRPLVVALVLVRSSLTHAERAFVAWGGLRGAVPILLAFFVVIEDVPHADTVYSVVFVVVALSILVQGVTLPMLGRRLGLVGPPIAPAGSSPDHH